MKKILKMMSITLIICLMSTTVVFAEKRPTAQLIQQELLSLGVPNTYVGNIIEYLQKIEISEHQYNRIQNKLDEAKIILNGEYDVSKFNEAERNKLKNLASEAASIIGVRVVFGKDSKGVTTVNLLDANNSSIVSLDTFNVIYIVENFELKEVNEIIIDMIEFSNNPEKNEFQPIEGEFNNTGTNVGYKMALGLGLIMLSGITFVATKKRAFV